LVEYSDQKKSRANGGHFQIGRRQNWQNFNVIIIRNGAKKKKSPNFVWGLNKKQQTQYVS
jgi:hypothetical protein